MESLESLPADQRAVLELVLRRGRSYDEIADMLSIDRAGVRARALGALDSIGPQNGVSAERRALITDYLLGRLPSRVAEQIREMLATNPEERAWARVVASELAPIAREPLPEIPAQGRERSRPADRPPVATPPRPRPAPSPRPSSRLGGVVVLGAGGLVAVAVVVVLIVVLTGGSSKHPVRSSRLAAHRPTTPAAPTVTTSTGTQVLAQINLNPPTGGKAKGVAEVLRQSGKTGIAIVAESLSPNTTHPPNAYAVWLYNSPTDSHILGFVNPGVGKTGRLQTAGALPSTAAHYGKLLVTLETQSNPKTPGTIVLEGTLTGVP